MTNKRRYFYDTEFMETPGSIELISIGIVPEVGGGLYAESSEFDPSHANDFVRDHVLTQLEDPAERIPRRHIAEALIAFLQPSKESPIELWGYYSAYDHVVLCWLFGRMVDLPPGMPMWTRDIKQLCQSMGNPQLPPKPQGTHHALADAEWTRDAWRYLQNERIARG